MLCTGLLEIVQDVVGSGVSVAYLLLALALLTCTGSHAGDSDTLASTAATTAVVLLVQLILQRSELMHTGTCES
jgi:hypothetical protein